MEVADVLVMLDGDHPADFPAGDRLFQFPEERAVPQHVAHRDVPSGPDRCFLDGQRLLRHRGDRLFQQQVVAFFHRGHRFPVMVPVHRRDDGRVAHPGFRQQRFPEYETFILRDPEFFRRDLPLHRVRLSHCGDLVSRFMRVPGIDHSPLPGADQYEFHINLRVPWL